MQLTRNDQAWLLQALERLAAGDDRRFEDCLWLGFGDSWRPMLAFLCRKGYVEMGGADRATPRITSNGTNLSEQLRRALAAEAV